MRLPLCFLNGSARGGKDKWEGVIDNPPAGSPSRQIKRRRTIDSPHRISQTQTLIRPLVKRRSFRYNESWRSNAVVWEVCAPAQGRGSGLDSRVLPLFASYPYYSTVCPRIQGIFLRGGHFLPERRRGFRGLSRGPGSRLTLPAFDR